MLLEGRGTALREEVADMSTAGLHVEREEERRREVKREEEKRGEEKRGEEK